MSLHNLLYHLLRTSWICQARFPSGFMPEDALYWGRGRGDTGVRWTWGVHGEWGQQTRKTLEKHLKSDLPFPKSWKKECP